MIEEAPSAPHGGEARKAQVSTQEATPIITKAYQYKKVLIPDRLKTDDFRFIKLIGKTKLPQEKDWQDKNNYAWNGHSLQKHISTGNNYGVLGGYGGLIGIDADEAPLIGEVKRKLPKTFTVGSPHGDGIHTYNTTKDNDIPSPVLFDPIVDKSGKRKNIGNIRGGKGFVVGASCSVFDCKKCGAHDKDIEGTGRHIKCKKCGYVGDGVERFYEVVDNSPIAEVKISDVQNALSVYLKTQPIPKDYTNKEMAELTFAHQEFKGIMDIVKNAGDLTPQGGGLYRGRHPIPHPNDNSRDDYFTANAKKDTWYCHVDGTGGGILQLIGVQEGIINCEDCVKGYLRGENFLKVMDVAKEKYGITLKRDEQQQEKKKSKKEKYKEKLENDTAEILAFLHDKYTFVTTEDTQTIYCYRDGVYEEAERLLETEIERFFNITNSTYFTKETINHLRRETYAKRSRFNTDKTRIPLNNGLFNLTTFTLEPFDVNKIFTFRFPVTYNADAKCPDIQDWIEEIVNGDSVKLLQEYCGYGFVPHLPLHKTLWLHGTGRNGKGAFIRLYSKLIGDRNASDVPLEQMTAKYRFALMRLMNSFINVCSEPQSNYIFQTEIFKKLTGGDRIEGEIKGLQETIKFTSFAKMFIMGNKYPNIDDDTVGFWDRMEIVKFPNDYSENFTADIENLKIEEDGGEEHALAGFFNWCMDGLKRLKKNKYQLTKSESGEKTRLEFEKVSNSARAFITECVELAADAKYPQPYLWEEYKNYCADLELELQTKSVLTAKIGELRGVHLKKGKFDHKSQRLWMGLGFKKTNNDEEDEKSDPQKNLLKQQTKNDEPPKKVDKVDKVDKLRCTPSWGNNIYNTRIDIKRDIIGEYIRNLSTLSTLSTPEKDTQPIEIKKIISEVGKCKSCKKEEITLIYVVHYSNDAFKKVCEDCGKQIMKDYGLKLIGGGKQ